MKPVVCLVSLRVFCFCWGGKNLKQTWRGVLILCAYAQQAAGARPVQSSEHVSTPCLNSNAFSRLASCGRAVCRDGS